MYPLTLCSSTAKVFIASCIRSNEVDFQTKSAEKLCEQSLGTPSFRRSSRAISSETSSPACQRRFGIEPERLTVGNLDDMTEPFPRLVQLPVVPQS